MKTIIYYGDNAAYSGDPQLAPARDVQVIVQPDDELGWVICHSHDYYVWEDARWLGVDQFGMYDYLIRDGWKRVLCGRTLARDEFNSIYQIAKAECGERNRSERGELVK